LSLFKEINDDYIIYNMSKVGRIYRIIHLESDIQYVGSTFNTVRDRFRIHKENFGQWLKDESKKKCAIVPYLKKFGIDKFKAVLVKEYEVCDRKHLEAYEALWICKLKCVNQKVPFNLKRLYKQQWAANNAEKVKQQKLRHYNANKDDISARQKQRYEANKDAISAKHKQYYEANKERLNAKTDCECSGRYSQNTRAAHFKTKKHQAWAQSN
jgi:hypothetical protein